MTTLLERHPIAAEDDERQALQQIALLLEQSSATHPPRLMGPHDEEIPLSPSVVQALSQLVHSLAHSKAVTVISLDKELTTQQAADILNVSRPYLIQRLEDGTIPFTRIGAGSRWASAHAEESAAARRRSVALSLTLPFNCDTLPA